VSGSPRMLVAFTFAAAVVVGAIIALATGQWWVLAAAVLLHFAGTAFVLTFIWKRMDEQDKPDPLTEARLEDARRG
jgi:membrane protein implicated in regulation of membrane protease activity